MNRHQQQLHQAEKARVVQTVQSPAALAFRPPETVRDRSAFMTPLIITESGIKFQIVKGGSKLVRLNGMSSYMIMRFSASLHPSEDPDSAMRTPKETFINGVAFKRSKNGNLIRSMAINTGLVSTVPPVRLDPRGGFLTRFDRLSNRKKKTELCISYTSTGT